jgi:hypothetical protein
MNGSLQALAERKKILVARSHLERMQLMLYAGDVRAALRPAGLIGGAIARPAAALALVNTIAPLFGWTRITHVVRLGVLALVVFRFVRAWRSSTRPHTSSD